MSKTIHSYKSSGDICTNCGKAGGYHYSDNGISWCWPPLTRRRENDDPSYQTHFSYNEMKENNPNKTFIREV